MMNQRVTAKKMHKCEYPTSYKVDGQHCEISGAPRATHGHDCIGGYVGTHGFGSKLFALTCLMMVTAVAAQNMPWKAAQDEMAM